MGGLFPTLIGEKMELSRETFRGGDGARPETMPGNLGGRERDAYPLEDIAFHGGRRIGKEQQGRRDGCGPALPQYAKKWAVKRNTACRCREVRGKGASDLQQGKMGEALENRIRVGVNASPIKSFNVLARGQKFIR